MGIQGATGYYGSGVPAQPAPGGWPPPVIVPVNNYRPGGAAGADAYVQTAVTYAPYIAGVAPGKAAVGWVAEAKTFFARARSARTPRAAANASSSARGAMMSSIKGAVMSSVLVNGIISAAINGYKVYNKQETTAEAGAYVAGDLASAVVGGAAGGAASAAGTFLLAGILGTGLPLTIVGMGLGVVGYIVADKMLRQTEIFRKLTTSVHSMLSGR